MKKNIIYTIFLSIILISCNKTAQKNIKLIANSDFLNIEKISGEVILKNDHNKNRNISIIDSLLLLGISIGSGNHFYTVYNKNSLTEIGKIGVKGNGPNEWKYLRDNNQFEKSSSGISIWTNSFEKGFLYKLNITKTLKSGKPNPVIDERISIDSKIFPFLSLFYVNNRKVVGNSWFNDPEQVRIQSYDPITKSIKKSNLFPIMKNQGLLPAEVINSLYSTRFTKHPSKNMFAQAMYMFNRIDVFDENLKLVYSIVDGNNWEDNYYDEKEIDPESNYFEGKTMGYDGITSTNNFLIAVDYKRKRSNIDNSILESHIKIFNWEGSPICLLKITDDIYSAFLDEDEGMLYGIDENNEKILRYNIKNLIKKW